MDKSNVYIHTKECYSIIKNGVLPNRITENWVNQKLILNVKQTKQEWYGIANIFVLIYVCAWEKAMHTLINTFCGEKIPRKNEEKQMGYWYKLYHEWTLKTWW